MLAKNSCQSSCSCCSIKLIPLQDGSANNLNQHTRLVPINGEPIKKTMLLTSAVTAKWTLIKSLPVTVNRRTSGISQLHGSSDQAKDSAQRNTWIQPTHMYDQPCAWLHKLFPLKGKKVHSSTSLCRNKNELFSYLTIFCTKSFFQEDF